MGRECKVGFVVVKGQCSQDETRLGMNRVGHCNRMRGSADSFWDCRSELGPRLAKTGMS